MTKTFKIGDIVEANEASNHLYYYTTQKRGWRGKVVKVVGGTFDATAIEGRDSAVGEMYRGLTPKYFDLVTSDATKQSIEIIEGLTVELTAEQLEEVSCKLQSAKDKAKKAPEPKLKVGDWIRIKNYADWYDISAKSYKIVEIDEDGDGVFYDDDNDRRNTFGKDFEIIDKLTPFDRAGRKPNEFKKGDIVRVVDAMGGNNMVGDLVEVYLTDGTDTPKVVDRDGDAVWEKAELVTPVENRVDIAEGGERA